MQELPGTEQLAKNNGPDGNDNGTLNGVGVADLDQQTRQQLKVPDNIKGVVITEVQPDSPPPRPALSRATSSRKSIAIPSRPPTKP